MAWKADILGLVLTLAWKMDLCYEAMMHEGEPEEQIESSLLTTYWSESTLSS